MWDLIVSVPDHCLSFYFDPVIQMVKVNSGSPYEKIGSTRVSDAVYQVSRSSAS